MHGYLFAISEERGPTITVAEVKPWRRAVLVRQRYDLRFIRSDRNKGLEGVTYDPVTDSLYTCQEQDPMKVWQVLPDGRARQILNARTRFPMRDLAGMYYNPAGDDGLYILSQQTNVVLKYGFDGEVMGGRAKVEGRQPEGVTFTPDGHLMIVVGEPNLMWFYTSTGRCSWQPGQGDADGSKRSDPGADAAAEAEPKVQIHDEVETEEGFVAVVALAFSGLIERQPSELQQLYLRRVSLPLIGDRFPLHTAIHCTVYCMAPLLLSYWAQRGTSLHAAKDIGQSWLHQLGTVAVLECQEDNERVAYRG